MPQSLPQNLPAVFCAIDTPDPDRAASLAASMEEAGCGIKLGLEFFCANGPAGIQAIRDSFPDLPVFLDLKFHDIPNTVAGAVRSVVALAPAYMTIHAGGGADMMRAAQDNAIGESTRLGINPPVLLAVTVLTSLTQLALNEIGVERKMSDQVTALAGLALDSGIGGIVCSPMEVAALRQRFGVSPVLMVPGIRPAGTGLQDQKRVMTPHDAMEAGATHLVIGRPITGADDPGRTALDILESLLKKDVA